MPSERLLRPENELDVNLDVDFVALAARLRSSGAEVVAVLLEGPAFRCPESVGLSKEFQRLGAEVFWVQAPLQMLCECFSRPFFQGEMVPVPYTLDARGDALWPPGEGGAHREGATS